jgi:hypothetical protein
MADRDPPFPPKWLPPFINIVIGTTVVVGYLVLFLLGVHRAWFRDAAPTWPVANEDVQSLLAGIGGIAATLFAMTLGLPTDDKVHRRSAKVLSIWPPRPDATGIRNWDWEGFERRVLVGLGVTLVLAYLVLTPLGLAATIWRTDHTPEFIAKFSGPGVAALLTAATLWLGRLARR